METSATFGSWVIRETDFLGRRARVECSSCGERRMFSTESLRGGSAKACGCGGARAEPGRKLGSGWDRSRQDRDRVTR